LGFLQLGRFFPITQPAVAQLTTKGKSDNSSITQFITAQLQLMPLILPLCRLYCPYIAPLRALLPLCKAEKDLHQTSTGRFGCFSDVSHAFRTFKFVAHLSRFNLIKTKQLIRRWRIHGAFSIMSISHINLTCPNPLNDHVYAITKKKNERHSDQNQTLIIDIVKKNGLF
jgi:hypothetical protein